MGRFCQDPRTIAKAAGPRGPWLQEHCSCRISGISLFVIDKSCPLLRRGRGDEFLETQILSERIEHWIEPEERGSERHAKPESA